MYKKVVVVALAAILSGCQTTGETRPDGTQERSSTGAVLGAITGAVVGYQVDRKKGAVVGAVVGGVGGYAIGNYMDEQEKRYEEALAEERRTHQVEITRLEDDLLQLTLSSEASFDVNRADVKPAFRPTLQKLGDVCKKYNRTNLTVIGHTDSTGSADYNRQLSQRRAQAVADYLIDQGVSPDRIRVVAQGEDKPRADNTTAAGRQLNRRVEILIEPDPSWSSN